jgi:tRNA pseudouridine13 synthase
MSYIANPIPGENEESFMVRDQLEKTKDFAKALKCFPAYLNFEKAILNKLVVNSEDFAGALKELPQNLLTMFVYAYQSFIFNKILSERIMNNLPLNKAVLGDIVLPVRKGVIDKSGIKVKENNIEKVNRQISKGKAVISGLLLGCDSEFSDGLMGGIEHKIVKNEGIDPRDFIIPDIPFISSTGSRRPLLAFVKNLDFKLVKDDFNNGKYALILKFELDKGCYATCLLREFMKADNIRNY